MIRSIKDTVMDNSKINKSEITQRISRDSLNGMEMKTIPVICPWCNRIFKMSKWEVDKDKKTGVTHGICPECFEKTLNDAANPKESTPKQKSSETQRLKALKAAASAKEKPSDRFRNFFKLKK